MEQDQLAGVLGGWATALSPRAQQRLSTYDLRALYDAARRARADHSPRPLWAWRRELSPAAQDAISDNDLEGLLRGLGVPEEHLAVRAQSGGVVVSSTELGPPARPEHARMGGYTGDSCRVCGSSAMVNSGTCVTCQDCGSTTGCS